MLLLLAVAVTAAHAAYIVDPGTADLVYDGHGALSAGASSRLLYDYDEPYRTQILDYLFTPKFGASLHLLKVEIGGDSQSTDGTEASHMHYRDDLGCNRGYEWWLLEQARARNPNIKTYALSWAVPYWVGNQTGYYCEDNINYHVKWLECARDNHTIGNIDYIGNWNERSWGPPDWSVQFRAAMDAAGFNDTLIIVPDGGVSPGDDLMLTIATDPAFAAAIHGIGSHYPCDDPIPEIINDFGMPFWASEDFSTVADWAGAGCWGRLLNQNFVRMNMTATIAWSLIWSVYPDWPYFGNGLMYAYQPWANFYTVNGPIWTSAHTTQFTEVGWQYLPVSSGGSGYLANGGSYVSLVAPGVNATTGLQDFSIVIEKLEGACLRCAGQSATPEVVTFQLVGGLELHNTLSFWSTNETAQFVQLPSIAVPESGLISFIALPDTIYTISSTTGQQKGSFDEPVPPSAPFPFPYADNFNNYTVDEEAAYFADDGGCFLIAMAPQGVDQSERGMVLQQFVINQAGVNEWVSDTPPISIIGDNNWTDYRLEPFHVVTGNNKISVTVDIRVEPGAPSVYSNIISLWNGLCVDVNGKNPQVDFHTSFMCIVSQSQSGAFVDTWQCVPDYNEQFMFDNTTQQFVEMQVGMCLATEPCLPGVVGICQVTCDSSSANQKWMFNSSDGTIRLAQQSGWCLQVAPAADANIVFLAPCSVSATPIPAQQWAFSTNAQYAGLFGRLSEGGDRDRAGYGFTLSEDGAYALVAESKVLFQGHVDVPVVGSWHTLSLNFSATTVTASINGSIVASVVDGTFTAGLVAVVSGWGVAFFDNFAVL